MAGVQNVVGVKSGDLPKGLRKFLWEEGVVGRHPTWVVCDSDNRVIRTGGSLDFFGVPSLNAGVALIEQAPIFLGLETSRELGPLHFPFLEMVSSLIADLFAVPVGDENWYLLLDTTREAEFQRRRQHVSHQRELKRRETEVAEEWLTVSDPLAALAAFDSLVLERTSDGRLMRVGDTPKWLDNIWPDGFSRGHYFDIRASPFLEHFMIDAEEAWWAGEGVMLRSGAFAELDGMGTEWQLEATAVQSRGRSLLIIQEIGTQQREKFELLQQARNRALEHSHLLKQIELKDVLLHCVVHDLSSPVSAVMMSLEAIENEDLSENARELMEMSIAQLERQDLLIRMILDIFSAESTGKIGGEGSMSGADIVGCIADVRHSIEPLAAARNISFRVEVDDLDSGVTVPGERLRLSRIIANLVENARRHTGAGKEVVIGARPVDGDVYFSVEDEGPGVPPEMEGKLFDRFAQAGAGKGAAGLGLHFCRITVEAWGGSIGHDRSDEGRSRFWFTLPVADESPEGSG